MGSGTTAPPRSHPEDDLFVDESLEKLLNETSENRYNHSFQVESTMNEKTEPYDPLNYKNLAQNVVSALMDQSPVGLTSLLPFEGDGVYAIYYTGILDYYQSIKGDRMPIYVGSAVPAGKRKGSFPELLQERRTLFTRLMQHAKSIEQASNLNINDFLCRYLVVIPVWIGIAERFLIEHYRPIWNTVIDGFGNHDPGKGRTSMKRPRWDILHPGRPWAKLLKTTENHEDLIRRLL